MPKVTPGQSYRLTLAHGTTERTLIGKVVELPDTEQRFDPLTGKQTVPPSPPRYEVHGTLIQPGPKDKATKQDTVLTEDNVIVGFTMEQVTKAVAVKG